MLFGLSDYSLTKQHWKIWKPGRVGNSKAVQEKEKLGTITGCFLVSKKLVISNFPAIITAIICQISVSTTTV